MVGQEYRVEHFPAAHGIADLFGAIAKAYHRHDMIKLGHGIDDIPGEFIG